MNQETMNERLDRIEKDIASLKEVVNRIKPSDINKKEIIKMLDNLQQGLKPIKTDKNDRTESEVKRLVTKEFITRLYRGK